MAPTTERSSLIEVDRRHGYSIIGMSRPEKRNALNREARQALLEAFAGAERAGDRVVILTGVGESFCSGADIVERRKEEADGVAPDAGSDWIEIVMAMRNHPAIFIAAVNGGAMGGGAALINVADLAIASDAAWVSNPEIGFGAFPHFSGPASQRQLLPKHAAWMIYTAERIDGRTAASWGVVNECVAPEALLARAEELAGRIASFEPAALVETKRALDATLGSQQDWRSLFERGMQVNTLIRERTGTAQLASAVTRMTEGKA